MKLHVKNYMQKYYDKLTGPERDLWRKIFIQYNLDWHAKSEVILTGGKFIDMVKKLGKL